LDSLLPRPLSVEDDARLEQQLRSDNDLLSNALLLLRGTGLRIGELVDLASDCLHPIDGEHWAIRVPLGKLHSERWTPVDQDLRQTLARLSFLRTLPPGNPAEHYLLPRPRGRIDLMSVLRHALRAAAQRAGCSVSAVPHQLRHTYASDMLRRGVSLIGVMKLLGHSTPRMTLRYIEVTQTDLQREFLQARLHPRHLPPALPASASPLASQSVLQSLQSALYLLDCRRQQDGHLKALDPFRRRLVKLVHLAEKLLPPQI
jgi:site-specific recombinase XerD